MASADEVLAQATFRTETVSVCVRGDLREKLRSAARRYIEQRAADELENRSSKHLAPAIAAEIVELERQAAAATVDFHMAAIGSTAWGVLLAEHPDPNGKRMWDVATFPPAAIAASIVEPEGWTAEKVTALAERISDGDFQALWQGCLEVNAERSELPKFGALFAPPPSSEPSSTTADPEAFPTASS
jgi:hypothetical protein